MVSISRLTSFLSTIFIAFTMTSCTARDGIVLQKMDSRTGYLTSAACVDIEKVGNKANPIDLYRRSAKCVEEKKYEAALALYLMAGVYGKFDTYRVTDRTAHQAPLIAMHNTFSHVDFYKRSEFDKKINKFFETKEEIGQMCQRVKAVGYPDYSPDYMISHGIRGINASIQGRSIANENNTEFSPVPAFEMALKEYLECGKN